MKHALVLGLFAALSFPGYSQEAKKLAAAELTAADLTAKVLKVYSSCDTYRDSCALHVVAPEQNHGVEFKAVAKTAYQRGGVFRFQSGAPPKKDNAKPEFEVPTQVVWSDGKQIKMGDGFEGSVRLNEKAITGTHSDMRSWLLGMALWTFESSTEIPLLILPVDNSRLRAHFQVNRCAIEKPEKVDKHPCYVMAESFTAIYGKTNMPMTISRRYWIDQKSFLIRRFQFEDDYRNGEKRICTLNYQPEINVKLSKEELELNPPKK